MLPAVAQGAIGIEIRIDNEAIAQLVAPLDDPPTAVCVTAERAFLARLEGSCRTPIAGLAELHGDQLDFRGLILAPDGHASLSAAQSGAPREAAALGDSAAADVLARGGASLIGRTG